MLNSNIRVLIFLSSVLLNLTLILGQSFGSYSAHSSCPVRFQRTYEDTTEGDYYVEQLEEKVKQTSILQDKHSEIQKKLKDGIKDNIGVPTVKGPRGATGPPGSRGAYLFIGQPGRRGARGARGLAGEIGYKGPPGYPGPIGEPGPYIPVIDHSGPNGIGLSKRSDPIIEENKSSFWYDHLMSKPPLNAVCLEDDSTNIMIQFQKMTITKLMQLNEQLIERISNSQKKVENLDKIIKRISSLGIVGPQGHTGPPGIPGLDSYNGDTGQMGARGANGNIGQPGNRGPPGVSGIKGFIGPRGFPAYSRFIIKSVATKINPTACKLKQACP